MLLPPVALLVVVHCVPMSAPVGDIIDPFSACAGRGVVGIVGGRGYSCYAVLPYWRMRRERTIWRDEVRIVEKQAAFTVIPPPPSV